MADETISPQQRKLSKRIAVLILICMGLVAYGLFFLETRQSAQPLPASVTSGLSYPVYSLKSTVDGYVYKSGSAKARLGILFYTLENGSKNIYVTEQAAPATTINLSSLPSHSSLSVPIGQAVLGTGLGNPSIVIMTHSSLIELTSNKGVTKADITGVAQKLTQQN